jgi:hypothetical protein
VSSGERPQKFRGTFFERPTVGVQFGCNAVASQIYAGFWLKSGKAFLPRDIWRSAGQANDKGMVVPETLRTRFVGFWLKSSHRQTRLVGCCSLRADRGESAPRMALANSCGQAGMLRSLARGRSWTIASVLIGCFA